MTAVIDINIGGTRFTMEEPAYKLLKDYLDRFEASVKVKGDIPDVMEDVEARVAEILQKNVKVENQIVDYRMVEEVIACLGDVAPRTNSAGGNSYDETASESRFRPTKKLYRSVENRQLAGVCAGLAAYFDVDVTLIRIGFLAALLLAGSTFWVYVIIWIATPKAQTAVQKLEMRGIPVTPENLQQYGNDRC